MAVPIEFTDLNPREFVPPSSRYMRSSVIKWSEHKITTFETYKREPRAPYTDEDQYMAITPGLEYRPDLASYDLYGVPDFWWRLLEDNGMKDIMEFKAGKQIRVPKRVI